MYRLLLPGIRLKRWILVNLTGMLIFAAGLWLLLQPSWYYQIRSALWMFWQDVIHASMPPAVVILLGILFLLIGLALVVFGTHRLVTAFTRIANPKASGRQLIGAMLDQRQINTPRLRIVGLGGGTGLSTLLRGLKAYPVDLTAIVTVSDDGGSSGRLRAGLDMPPPGDIRNCLVALADSEPLMEHLFQHRFAEGSHDLTGHSLGNLIIAGLNDLTGDFQEAIQEASRVLAVRGRVIPSANQPLILKATMSDGTVVRGETAITAMRCTVASVDIEPSDILPLPEALEAIRDADIIIVGPGSVYSSLLPNLIIPGMADALYKASAIKIFICNVMTQPGESDDFTASRHLQAVLEQLSGKNPFHYAMVNLQRPASDVIAMYEAQGQRFVEPDLARVLSLGTMPVTGSLLAPTHLARHDPDKLARCILERVAEDIRWPEVLQRQGQ